MPDSFSLRYFTSELSVSKVSLLWLGAVRIPRKFRGYMQAVRELVCMKPLKLNERMTDPDLTAHNVHILAAHPCIGLFSSWSSICQPIRYVRMAGNV
jgi:hypothetical protein